MNLFKNRLLIKKHSLILAILVSFFAQGQSQDFEYSGLQLSQPFISEFTASPDGKNLLYNVVTHNTIDFRSRFYVQHLESGGEDTELGVIKAYIHGWLDNENVILANENNEFVIKNIYTLKEETFKSPAPIFYEPLLVSPDYCIFSEGSDNQTTYHFYKNGTLEKSVNVPKEFIFTNYDVATNSIIEVAHSGETVDVYQYAYLKDKRTKLASLPTGKNRVITKITLKDNALYYLEDYQEWDELDMHQWDKSLMTLSSYDLNTNTKKIIHSFDKGVECLNMEIISADKFLVIQKDHLEINDVMARKDMENNTNSKELNAATFAKITDQFKGSISAKTMINAIKNIDADYQSVYVKGSSIALALSGLPKETKDIIRQKVDKLVISNGNVTVKLKDGVSYVKLPSVTENGSSVTVKLMQGTTVKFTEVNSDKVYAKIKGVSIWMAIKYASIGAISIQGQENTLSVFTSMGVGFWTTHKLGSITRRIE